MKKIIIIGGGVAGLTAGICGQKSGYETVIYEKNPWTGGSCSAWKRGDYVIDNCLHWLTGTKEGSPDKEMWRDLGVLKEGEPLIHRKYFLASEADGQKAVLWDDLDRTRKELLELSPEDAEEINAFINCVQFFADVLSTDLSTRELYRSIKDFNSSLNSKSFEFTRHFVQYLNVDSQQLAKKFKNKAIQSLFLDFMAKEYESYWLMLAYCFYVTGSGELPTGGSYGMARNMTEKYLSLGGKIVTGVAASKILIDRKNKTMKVMSEEYLNGKSARKLVYRHATGVLFEDGTTATADYIIPACDIYFTYRTLLDHKYTPASLRKLYRRAHQRKGEIYSSFQMAFSVDGTFDCVEDTLGFECRPLTVGTMEYERFVVKNYRVYGDYIAPEGKTVVQVSIPQYEKDFTYWKHLAKDREEYRKVKTDTAMKVMAELERRFPDYTGKFHLLDVWTPYSYSRINNDYLGAYMRYITTPFSFNAFLSAEVAGIDNVVLASHYLRYPGGLPTAAYTGRDAIELIKKMDNPQNTVTFFRKVGEEVGKTVEKMPEIVAKNAEIGAAIAMKTATAAVKTASEAAGKVVKATKKTVTTKGAAKAVKAIKADKAEKKAESGTKSAARKTSAGTKSSAARKSTGTKATAAASKTESKPKTGKSTSAKKPVARKPASKSAAVKTPKSGKNEKK